MNKNFVFNTIGNITYLFALWLITILITKIVGYEENGVFTVAMSLVNVLYVLSSYGLRGFQVSDIEGKYSKEAYVLNRFTTSIFAFILTIILGFVFNYSLYTIGIIILFMIYKSFEALSDVYHGFLQMDGKLYIGGISMTIKGILSIVAFFIVLLFTKEMWIGLLVMCLVAGIVFVFDVYFSGLRVDKTIFDKEIFKESIVLLKEALPMMLFMMTTPLMASIPKLILEEFYGMEILGIYSTISTPTVIISTLTSCVMIPLLPKWKEYYNNKNRSSLAKSVGLSNIIVALLGIASMFFCCFFGNFFFVWFFGPSISEYTYHLVNIMLVTTITAIIMCYNSFFVVARKLYLLLIISVSACVLNLLFSFLFIPSKEITGVIIALLISEGIQLLIMLSYIIFKIFKLNKINTL